MSEQQPRRSLQAYKKERIAWRDMRFIFTFTKVFEGKGGLQMSRDVETTITDTEICQGKWSPYIEIDNAKDMVKFHFKRTNERANIR